MNVLIAQEESQAICKEFRRLGHEAYSCDLQSCSGGHPGWHIKDDIRNVLSLAQYNRWDLIIAHPVCQYMSNSGSRWLYTGKGLDKRCDKSRWEALSNAIDDFNLYVDYHNATGVPMCIENPQPHKHAVNGFYGHPRGIGEKSQIIQPYQFGHPESKKTYLWLFNLPHLIPTEYVPERSNRLHNLTPDRKGHEGKQGWELVSVCLSQDRQFNSLFYKTLYFKRAIQH